MFKTGHSKVGGRKPGTKNQKTLLGASELLLGLGINPIQKLVEIAESAESTTDQKINCYKEIAKYTYPKIKAEEVPFDQEAMNLTVQFVE
jgi:hypothetical protein